MAISIIAFSERFEDGRWVLVDREVMDFHSRDYSSFLAGVWNTSVVPPIAEPRGAPRDMSADVAAEYREDIDQSNDIEPSWLLVEEMLAFDYDMRFEDRRVARRMPAGYVDHAITGEPGQGKMVSYREFLGEMYFEELKKIARSGAQRIVFWFSK